jgi:mannose-6-phosphate isomerase-like protein (cupin superfamily)
MEIRRVVTGHDENGKSRVLIDDIASNATSRRAGHDSRLIWVTDAAPAAYDGNEDAGAREVGRPPPENGTLIRILEIQPGVTAEPHFTETIDYVIVMLGEMDMVLDTETVQLRAGDVLVQRGTMHNWVNHGPEPCRFAAILIDAARSDVAPAG